jgi:hypothetical protein
MLVWKILVLLLNWAVRVRVSVLSGDPKLLTGSCLCVTRFHRSEFLSVVEVFKVKSNK